MDELQLIVRRAIDKCFADMEQKPSIGVETAFRQREPTLFIRGEDGPAVVPERNYPFEFS